LKQKPRSNAISRPNPRPVSANGNWNHDLFYQNVNVIILFFYLLSKYKLFFEKKKI